jgi:hypothetical protein
VTEHALLAHPSAPPGAALALVVRAERSGEVLSLRYRLSGDLARVAVPTRSSARRSDDLWERTCFEAFVAPEGGAGYAEINLSPSTEWAVYAFDGYRAGMRALALRGEPALAVAREADALVVTASVDLSALAAAPSPWRVGLAAVVAAQSGAKSYWALEHPQAAPDFHASASFVIQLEGTP